MRSRRLDVALLAVLLPVWAAWLTLNVVEVAAGRTPVVIVPIRLDQARDASGHPIVRWIRPGWEEGRVLQPGDTLLRLGGEDLAGVTLLGLVTRALDHARIETPLPLTLRRGDAEVDVRLDLHRPHPISAAPVWLTLTSIAVVAMGVLLILRAPSAPAARPLSMALITSQLFFLTVFPFPPLLTYTYLVLVPLGASISGPCFLQGMLLLVDDVAPRSRFGRWWPWLFTPLALSIFSSQLFDVPFPSDILWRWLEPLGWGAFTLGMVAVLTWVFRRAGPIGRRRVKWVLYGCYLLYAPAALQAVLVLLGYVGAVDRTAFMLSGMLLPVCLLFAVVRHNLLDIDRVISVTASYTILGVLVLGAVLAGFPRAAAAASGELGLDPATGQLVLAVALAGILVPGHARLRPQIDRLFFAERYALERGVADLLGELSSCSGPEALYARVGERLDALLRPDACVVYVRASGIFAPVFVRGRGVAVPFDTASPLVAALSRRPTPLVADAWQRGRASTLGPFERAALETLGAVVVLPVHHGDALLAFVCLGAKRSGDIYTSTDMALLVSVTQKVSDELSRFELGDIIERGRAMEGALRRYVPAAVATQLASGGIERAERDVSVLFVDLRGYTGFAETRRATDVFATVNRYTEVVSAIARDRGGVIAEFSGDGMMVVFGAPQSLAAKECAAVEAGREIIDAVAALSAPGSGDLSVGVGIATGPAFVGDVRSAERDIWTAIGDTVNLAARLQQMTRALDARMVIDTTTWKGARYMTGEFVRHEGVAIRGRVAPEDVWVLPSTKALPASA